MKKVMLIGYHGLSNCGADARLAVLIDTLKRSDPSVEISYVTVDKDIEKHDAKKIVFSFFNFYIRLLIPIIRSDIVIIEEGGVFVDFWGSAFIRFFLVNIFFSVLFRKRVIVYSMGIDRLNRTNYFFTRKLLNRVDLITARSEMSYNRFKKMHLKCPVYHTTDCAISLKRSKKEYKLFPDNKRTIGFSLKDEFCFPIKFKLFGEDDERYHGNFFYTYANNGRARLDRFVDEAAGIINSLIKKGYNIVLLDFEPKIDTRINEMIQSRVPDKDRIRLISSLVYSPAEMKSVMSCLELLITSRVHPIIFSLEYNIPIIGIYHGGKLINIFKELGMDEYLIRYNEAHLDVNLNERIALVSKNKNKIKGILKEKYQELLKKNQVQEELLRDILNQ